MSFVLVRIPNSHIITEQKVLVIPARSACVANSHIITEQKVLVISKLLKIKLEK